PSAVPIAELGDRAHLRRRVCAGRAADRLERKRHDGMARDLVVGDRIVEPNAKARVLRARLGEFGRSVRELLIIGIPESRSDFGPDSLTERQAPFLHRHPFLFHFTSEFLRAELMNEYFYARLVNIVAPAVLVVG